MEMPFPKETTKQSLGVGRRSCCRSVRGIRCEAAYTLYLARTRVLERRSSIVQFEKTREPLLRSSFAALAGSHCASLGAFFAANEAQLPRLRGGSVKSVSVSRTIFALRLQFPAF